MTHFHKKTPFLTWLRFAYESARQASISYQQKLDASTRNQVKDFQNRSIIMIHPKKFSRDPPQIWPYLGGGPPFGIPLLTKKSRPDIHDAAYIRRNDD